MNEFIKKINVLRQKINFKTLLFREVLKTNDNEAFAWQVNSYYWAVCCDYANRGY